jgi:acetyl esterase/lipase
MHTVLKVILLTGWIALGISRPCAAQAGDAVEEARSPPMTPKTFQALPSKAPDHRIAYGTAAEQYGDLRLPTTAGPHPVVVLIHGGCLKSEYATLKDLAPMADALKAAGFATWNVEYRRLGNAGGGWPGTYLDAGAAVDKLRSLAAEYPLDISRVVVVGHSAGGHLAMWVAARPRLPKDSPLSVDAPLPVKGVVNLGGYGDLAAFRQVEKAACGGTAVAEAVLGGDPSDVPDRYAQVSASAMLPLGTSQVLIWGEDDTNTPLWLAQQYVQAARAAGDPVQLLILPKLGHFEIADPSSSAWPSLRSSIQSLLH